MERYRAEFARSLVKECEGMHKYTTYERRRRYNQPKNHREEEVRRPEILKTTFLRPA